MHSLFVWGTVPIGPPFSLQLGEDHAAGGGLQDAGDGDVRVFAQAGLAVLNDDTLVLAVYSLASKVVANSRSSSGNCAQLADAIGKIELITTKTEL